MPITRSVYEPSALFAVIREAQPINTFFSQFFQSRYLSTDEWIEMGRISSRRKLAPFVLPTAQGVPIYSVGEEVRRFKPAYIKPKDPVSPSHQLRRRVGTGELTAPGAGSRETPASRFNATVADILLTHRESILRRLEWMRAKAILDGMVTISGPGYPETVVDFQRPGGHTITLGVGARWGDAGVSILADIKAWRQIVRDAPFGGYTDMLTVGPDVWAVMQEDEEIQDLLSTQVRDQRTTVINRGLMESRPDVAAEYVGSISGVLDIYVYSDWYEDPANPGTPVNLMDPRDVLLSGPNVEGVEAFGAILDNTANFEPVEMYPKMWQENDPPNLFIMTQSAPIAVPTRPENTLKARVLA